MIMLILSLVTLALGPVLHHISRKSPPARAGLDGFVYVAIAGLVLTHILPECLGLCGWLFLVPCVVGFFAPLMLEHFLVRQAGRAHAAALFIGLVGLVLHNAVDGIALLSPPDAREDHGVLVVESLGLAVALHQIPVGLMVWILLRPTYGRAAALGAIALLCLATVAGYLWGGGLVDEIESRWSGVFQALVGGSLLHVVAHGALPGGGHDKARVARAAGIGGIIGIALVVFAVAPHRHEHHDHGGLEAFLHTFSDLALESAPSLLLGYVLATLVQVFLPKASTRWLNGGTPSTQALRGVAFGLPLPVCSCGVLPIYRSLALRGVAPAAALAFLVATPELGIDAVIFSWPMLGAELTIVRVVAAAVIALGMGWFLGASGLVRQRPETVSGGADAVAEAPPGPWRLSLRDRLAELFDSTSPWILLGLVVAAMLDPLLDSAILSSVPPLLQLPLCALVAMPLYVCATGATPLVAMLMAKGLSPGAAVVFLITGPATNFTTFGVMSKLHGRRSTIAFAVTMFGATILAGAVVNALMGPVHLPPISFGDHQHDHDHGAGRLQTACLALLGLMLGWALLRNGPRAYMAQLLTMPRTGDPASDSHDHAGHDHGAHAHDHGETEGDRPASADDHCCR
jgi:uncharacterized protein